MNMTAYVVYGILFDGKDPFPGEYEHLRRGRKKGDLVVVSDDYGDGYVVVGSILAVSDDSLPPTRINSARSPTRDEYFMELIELNCHKFAELHDKDQAPMGVWFFTHWS